MRGGDRVRRPAMNLALALVIIGALLMPTGLALAAAPYYGVAVAVGAALGMLGAELVVGGLFVAPTDRRSR